MSHRFRAACLVFIGLPLAAVVGGPIALPSAEPLPPVLPGVLRQRAIAVPGADEQAGRVITLSSTELAATFPSVLQRARAGEAPTFDATQLAVIAIAAVQELAQQTAAGAARADEPARRDPESPREPSAALADIQRRLDRLTDRVEELDRAARGVGGGGDRLGSDVADLRRKLDRLDQFHREQDDLRTRLLDLARDLADARRTQDQLQRDQQSLDRRVSALESRGR